jgi:hypothetical protein
MNEDKTIRCWTCHRPARIYDLHREKYFCEDCEDAQVNKEIERGLQREELIAFETFSCTHCGSKNSRPAFTHSIDEYTGDCQFAGWRVCRDCNRNFIELDPAFFFKARITPYEIRVVSGATEES